MIGGDFSIMVIAPTEADEIARYPQEILPAQCIEEKQPGLPIIAQHERPA